jgi:hypothetical protein
MAEILIRIRNHMVGGLPVPSRLARGEVVAICDDDHPWTTKEQENPDWRIVKLPNVPRHILLRLISRFTDEEDALFSNGNIEFSSITRLRAWKFNLVVLQSFLNDPEAVSVFRANPSWRALIDAGIIERTDT